MIHLNIGCGPYKLPGCVNADIDPSWQPDLLMDATQRWPFDDGQCCEVQARQFIEHLEIARLPHFFSEARRVLCAGGEIRIDFPDASAIAALAADGSLDDVARGERCTVPGVPDGLALLNYIGHGWGHRALLTLPLVLPLVRERFEVLWACVVHTNGLIIGRRTADQG